MSLAKSLIYKRSGWINILRRFFHGCLSGLVFGYAEAAGAQDSAGERNPTGNKESALAKVPENATWTVIWKHKTDVFRDNEVQRIHTNNKRREVADIEHEIKNRWPDSGVGAINVKRINNACSRGIRREVIEVRSGQTFENFVAGGWEVALRSPQDG